MFSCSRILHIQGGVPRKTNIPRRYKPFSFRHGDKLIWFFEVKDNTASLMKDRYGGSNCAKCVVYTLIVKISTTEDVSYYSLFKQIYYNKLSLLTGYNQKNLTFFQH